MSVQEEEEGEGDVLGVAGGYASSRTTTGLPLRLPPSRSHERQNQAEGEKT